MGRKAVVVWMWREQCCVVDLGVVVIEIFKFQISGLLFGLGFEEHMFTSFRLKLQKCPGCVESWTLQRSFQITIHNIHRPFAS